MPEDLDTSRIKNWRSIVTLITFVVTSKYTVSLKSHEVTFFFWIDIIVVFPFRLTVYIPRLLSDAVLNTLSALHIIAPWQKLSESCAHGNLCAKCKYFVPMELHLNFVTAPLIADLFLLAILAIGRQEVHDGTIGANNISPIDIMLFFLSLAYIAISIDASGLIRYLAFKVLQWGGDVGHRLFFYLYAFFFCLAGFIGNDPIILSGTAFLAYMTRVSSNITHPRAWIFTEFALANIASAILVSSNPTNLVLAGAFDIKFIDYTANMVVPVVITGIVLFPFLLYIIFSDPEESLIPTSIKMHELPEEARTKKPVNPNIPHAKGKAEDQEENPANEEQTQLLSLEEIMNPFLDKGGAAFGAVIMAATLITLLALDAASSRTGKHSVFWVTLPAAFVMFCWDIAFGWCHRVETRKIARNGRKEFERAQVERQIEREMRGEEKGPVPIEQELQDLSAACKPAPVQICSPEDQSKSHGCGISQDTDVQKGYGDLEIVVQRADQSQDSRSSTGMYNQPEGLPGIHTGTQADEGLREAEFNRRVDLEMKRREERQMSRPQTLVSLVTDAYRWSQETFPTATAVLAHLPFALVPFAFCMFVLVQALVTKGWVPVFAYGWYHWVDKTGTMGSIAGMGFLSVILCNVSIQTRRYQA